MTKEHAKEFVDKYFSLNTVSLMIVMKSPDGEFRSILSDGSGKFSLDAHILKPSSNVFDYLAKHPWNDSRDSVPDGLSGVPLEVFLAHKWKYEPSHD